MGCSNKKSCDICVNMTIAGVLAVVYFMYPSEWTKIIPILWMALNCGSDHYGSLIGYGLAVSSLGDIALEMNRSDPMYFMAGLVFFLIAHILYIQGNSNSNSIGRLAYSNQLKTSLVCFMLPL